MEPLWSPVVATRGKRRQMNPRQKPRKKGENGRRGLPPVACDVHGKEVVDGSSPSEGLKHLQIGYFCCLLRRVARDHYGKVSEDPICRRFWRPRVVPATKGNREGTRASLRPETTSASRLDPTALWSRRADGSATLAQSGRRARASASSSASACPSAYTAA
jgi:hypothetical protein